jgi:hypothetical protein
MALFFTRWIIAFKLHFEAPPCHSTMEGVYRPFAKKLFAPCIIVLTKPISFGKSLQYNGANGKLK